jgi:hypothetical protein
LIVIRVEVKNFQSIVHETIDIDGFSAVAGRSNIGKSALVRAIKAALTGAPADSYVRHSKDCPRTVKGAKSCKCYCSVRITAPDLDLLWEKGDTVNHYVYNGVDHTAAGTGTPEFLGDPFAMVTMGKDKVLLQVSDQFDPIFILDKSGTVVADTLSDVAKLDQINVAMRMSERDRKEAASTRKVRDKDREQLQTALVLYEGLDEYLSQVEAVERMNGEIERLEDQATRLAQLEATLQASAERMRELTPVESVLVPDIESSVNHFAHLIRLQQLAAQHADKQRVVDLLGPVSAVEIPTLEADTALTNRDNLVRWDSRLKTIEAFLTGAERADTTQVEGIQPLLDVVDQAKQLKMLDSKLSAVLLGAKTIKQDLATAEADEKRLGKELDNFVCPTCGSAVSTHSLEVAHA